MASELVLTATAILDHEHLAIKGVIKAMATIAVTVEEFRFVEPSLLADVTSFLRAFARQCQQAKEETLLYPLLGAKSVGSSACLIASLGEEHRRAERLSSEFMKSTSIYVSSGGARNEPLVVTLRKLIALYTQHLSKEDRLLLPMADKLLSTEEQSVLYRAFGNVNSEVALDELSAGIERQLAHPPSHLGEVLI